MQRTRAASAFLARQPPVLQAGEGKGTSPVVPRQAAVAADQQYVAASVRQEGNEYTASSALLERNEPAADRQSYTAASTLQLRVPGATPRPCGYPLSIVRRDEEDRDQRWRIEGVAFVLETCHGSTSVKR